MPAKVLKSTKSVQAHCHLQKTGGGMQRRAGQPSQAENSRKGQIRAVISIVKLQIAKSLNQPVLLIDSYCRRMVNVGIRMKFASGCKKGNQQNKAAVKKSFP